MSRPKRSPSRTAAIAADSPDAYINRDLSWLEFNDRVLREGLDEGLPPLERLKFLAITGSNLDEFFMIRVAGLRQQQAAGVRRREASGLTPGQQLERIGQRVRRMVSEQAAGVDRVLRELDANDVHLLTADQLSVEQRRFVASWFDTEVLAVLTPLAVEELDPCPLLPGLRLMLAVRLEPAAPPPAEAAAAPAGPPRVAIVPVPTTLPRFVTIPADRGLHLITLEAVIAGHVGALFPGHRVVDTALFRLTRDADVAVQEDAAADLLAAIERAVGERRRREPVRLELAANADQRLKRWLVGWSGVSAAEVYEIEGLLDVSALMELATRPGLDRLKVPDWPPQTPADLRDADDLWAVLRERDVLLFHPYESFEPVVRLLAQAADDPGVLAIKQTLYRTSGESPIIAALERAAQNGKQVVVLVELRARFDEARNIGWARRLEDAGAYVIYGIAGYKTHAKALLIIRREAHCIRRYVHLATGNYNDKTARLYSDLGLLTSDNEFAADTAAFFNMLTGYSDRVGWSRLSVAPGGLRGRFLELIERECQVATPEQPGLILAKLNSLQDAKIIEALYRASRGGVRIRLNVRGICCLRPGVPGLSENIEVISIVDRFLEHARIFYFHNGGHEEVYLGSADWMSRNLDRRLEILFPVSAPGPQRRLLAILRTFFADNVKARRLDADGTYAPVTGTGDPVRAQEFFHRQALEAARAPDPSPLQFQPLTRPEAR